MDRGYDNRPVYDACAVRDVRPVVPLVNTLRVKRGDHLRPSCAHGEWTFAGADARRARTKWRCPTGACSPASTWVRADRLHPLIPRDTARFKRLYKGRASVEREFGRLKNEWGLAPLRVRGLARVALHADLTILARLACTLAAERGHEAARGVGQSTSRTYATADHGTNTVPTCSPVVSGPYSALASVSHSPTPAVRPCACPSTPTTAPRDARTTRYRPPKPMSIDRP